MNRHYRGKRTATAIENRSAGPDPPPETADAPESREAPDSPEEARKTGPPPEKNQPPPGGRRSDPRKESALSPLFYFLGKLALFAALFAVIFLWVLGVQINRGDRMYPFILDGDLVVTYKLGSYREGDVVVYRNPETGRSEISRISAVGPAEVLISYSGQLLVDGFTREDRVFYLTRPLEESALTYPYQVGQDRYFLLDDHRNAGRDSRLFGELSKEDLLGKVVYVFRRRGI